MSALHQVGYANVGERNHAALWSGSAASWVDLHVLLAPLYVSSKAWGIWTDGTTTRIVGAATVASSGEVHAILWTLPPVSTPDMSLSLVRSNQTITLSWPLPADGWVLEQTQRLTGSPGAWAPVTADSVTNTAQVQAIVPIDQDSQFFRLRKP